MTERHALKPALYAIDGDEPRLRGGRCDCGHTFFPMQAYGCEKCGRTGAALHEALFAGTGRLVASARVLMHARKDRQAPFTIVSVKLDDGPVLRTLLAVDSDRVLPVGQRMRASLVEVPGVDPDSTAVDLRFVPA